MFLKIVSVCVYCLYVSGSDIFHEESKTTFYPDNVLDSEYFGFSVLLNPYGLIVGAPKAKNREKHIASGLVFNCTLKELDRRNVTCSPIPITGKDHYIERFRDLMPEFFRDDMWFGATIGALTDGKLLICAPRLTEPLYDKHLLANGACYVRKTARDLIVYPLKDKPHRAFRTDGLRREYGEYGQHLNYYAYGQVGISMKVTGDSHVIIGAPGILQWAGGIVNYLYSPDDSSVFFSMQATSNPYYTKDLGPDDYFGYSVESGVFVVDGPTLYVGGAPRSKMGYGQVLVFQPAVREQDGLNIRAKLRGSQLGSYFGASLCCLDIDGDGADDLLVGAPNQAMKDSGLPYDQGSVFVYMTKQMNPKSFRLEASGAVSGSGESGARFGTTIADLGDIDGDGFKDVAIGAPWENEGSGVVYIYRGYAKGLKSQYTQRILAENTGSFGISIAKGFDVDGNNCNDLAIGAATSTTVYVYRCIPTLLVHTSIKVPDAMNLPHNATGFTALFCVTLPKQPLWPHVRINFMAKIIIDPEGHRATISGDSKYEYKVIAIPGNERCDEQTVEVKPTADLSKPISMKFDLELDEMPNVDTTNFDHHAARVSEESNLKSSFLIQLVRDCGEDMICTPWLVMTLEALDSPFIPGTDSKLGARLTIRNEEEPAYGAKVNISLPMIPKRVPSPCSLKELVMTCEVPAPLLRGEEIVWDIELEYNLNSSAEVNLKVVAELEDSLYYRNISKDPVLELVLEVRPDASFIVTWNHLPNATVAVSREKLYGAENISFVNYIEIRNLGPSDWYDLEIHFHFDMANLSSSIKGCEDEETGIVCIWSVPAKVSLPIVLPLRLDLGRYGAVLEKNTTLNVTTEVHLFWKDHEPIHNYKFATTLVLDPAPPIWPWVLGIVAGLVFGLLLLALIVYLLHKYGFFSRNRHERLKELQEHSASENELEESADAPSTAGATIDDRSGSNESTRELLFEDSD